MSGRVVRSRRSKAQPFTKYHRNGAIWAKGQMEGGVPVGYWEWFRIDGSRLRSGYFEAGRQVGKWTTYDRAGAEYKVTQMPPIEGPPRARKTPSNKGRASKPAQGKSRRA